MKRLQFVLSLIDSINERIGKVIHLLIVPMVALIAFEVMMRYGLNSPTLWGTETTTFIFATYIILAGGYTFLYKAHVNVDVLYSRFRPRTRATVDLFTSMLLFAFCIALLWKGGEFAWRSVHFLESTGSPWNPPLYPIKLMVPLGALLLLLQGIAKFIRDFITATTGSELG